MQKGMLVAAFLPLFVACGSITDSSPLVGRWITESCEQLTDDNANLIDVWVRGIYDFSADGDIRMTMREYADSNCQKQTAGVNADTGFTISYEDLGEEFLQEGIDGRGLRVTYGSGLLSFSAKGFYVIDGDKACFSEAFRFDATGFGGSIGGADAIDFTSCLLASS